MQEDRWGTDHQFSALSRRKNNLLVNNVKPGPCFFGGKQMKWVCPFVIFSRCVWPAGDDIFRWTVGSSGATTTAFALGGEIPCATRDRTAGLTAVPNEQSVPNSLWNPKKSFCLAVLGFSTVSRLSEKKHPPNRTEWSAFLSFSHCHVLPLSSAVFPGCFQHSCRRLPCVWIAEFSSFLSFGKGGAYTAQLKAQLGLSEAPALAPVCGAVFPLLTSVIPNNQEFSKNLRPRKPVGLSWNKASSKFPFNLFGLRTWPRFQYPWLHGEDPYCIMSLKTLTVHWFS